MSNKSYSKRLRGTKDGQECGSFQILQGEGGGRREELHEMKRGARFTREAEQEHMRPEEQQGKMYSRYT